MAGMSLDMNHVENRSIAQHLSTTNADMDDDELDADATKARLEARKKAAQSTLFREREVDNLHALIYGEQKDEEGLETFGYSDVQDDMTTQADVTSNMVADTFRYDINHLRLQRYQVPNYKKLLKKKFVTG
jgi:benzoyl-CoA reductase/2-hydroxyglutaryl-CoA dehydratase subunit BcrC/BadD/HgdB